jgi:hypothetical protein
MSQPDLYELYGSTSLLNLERSIAAGKIPAAEELAAVLAANSEGQLPAWFIELIVKSLRGELKKKRGRPTDDSPLSVIRFQLARAKYHQYLAWLQKRQRSVGLKGWAVVRDQKVDRTAPRACGPNGDCALAPPRGLESLFEPRLVFIIIQPIYPE